MPIPQRPWESVSMDFISFLSKVGEHGMILVVVDRFLKYATFITASINCSMEETTYMFMKNVVKYWGVPHNIISDRDPRFTGAFLDWVIKAPRHTIKLLNKGPPLNRWPEQAYECLIRGIPLALCKCQPKELGELARHRSILLQLTTELFHQQEPIWIGDRATTTHATHCSHWLLGKQPQVLPLH